MKLVIFDCDGTLVDSQHAIFDAMQQAFDAERLPAPERADVLSVIGLSLPEAFHVLAPAAALEARNRLVARYKAAFPATAAADAQRDPLYPGAREAVAALAAREDVVLGIATGKSQRGVRRLIEQEGWHGVFRTIQTADENPSKPHPAMVRAAMEAVGVTADATVMIGDTRYDIEMGRNAWVATIGVGWGYHATHELESAGAHMIVDRFDALEAAIHDVLGVRR